MHRPLRPCRPIRASSCPCPALPDEDDAPRRDLDDADGDIRHDACLTADQTARESGEPEGILLRREVCECAEDLVLDAAEVADLGSGVLCDESGHTETLLIHEILEFDTFIDLEHVGTVADEGDQLLGCDACMIAEAVPPIRHLVLEGHDGDGGIVVQSCLTDRTHHQPQEQDEGAHHFLKHRIPP